MQALCQWDTQHVQSTEALLDLFSALEAGAESIGPAVEIVEKYWSDPKSIDARIGEAATKWDLSRISPVDRNVMRVAIVEASSGAVPPRVAIDEAIEIAGEYGGADSPRFVNGVLDAVFRKMSLLE